VEDDTRPKESSRGANETAFRTRRCKRRETTHSSGDCYPNGVRWRLILTRLPFSQTTGVPPGP